MDAAASLRTEPMRFMRQLESPAENCGADCRVFVFASGMITAETPRHFEAFAREHDLTGATVAFDLWGQFMWLVFNVRPSSLRLMGRWLLHMPAGVLRHARIDASPPMRFECAVGWIA